MPSTLQLQRINTNTASTTTTSANSAVNSFCKHHHHNHQTSSLVVQLPSCISMPDDLALHHTHLIGPNQCCSSVVQTINAPIESVWTLVRRFDNPQAYKHFLKSCHVILGDGDVGSLRKVHVISGLPAGSSTERLEILDDESHVISFSVVGGDHRLVNYRSVTTLHRNEGEGTVVVESYVVDVPVGNTKEDTCAFVDTIVRCNLQSLAQVSEKLVKPSCQRGGCMGKSRRGSTAVLAVKRQVGS